MPREQASGIQGFGCEINRSSCIQMRDDDFTAVVFRGKDNHDVAKGPIRIFITVVVKMSLSSKQEGTKDLTLARVRS